MFGSRSHLALIAILGLLAPLGQGLALCLHLWHEDEHTTPFHFAAAEVSLHGHAHDPSIPAHSHESTAPQVTARRLEAVTLAAFHGFTPCIPSAATNPLSRWKFDAPTQRTGSGWLPPTRLAPILRI
jgi:hypothetical protein